MPAKPSANEDNLKKFHLAGERFHVVTQYGDDLYKITQHYSYRPWTIPGRKKAAEHSDVKLSSSISRTRRLILEYALANDWDFFITITLSDAKVNRFDLDAWHTKFNEWLKYRRKAYGLKFQYLIVPELHGDGAWHAHGLCKGLTPYDLQSLEELSAVPCDCLVSFQRLDSLGFRTDKGKKLPRKLVSSDYFNWPSFSDSFGYVSVGKLKNKEAASFYVTKYITKDLARCVSVCGKHMYWVSKGLNKPQKFGEFYDRNSYIDSLLVNQYEFCSTGFVLPPEGWCSELASEMIESVGGCVFAGAAASPLFSPSVEVSHGEVEADAFHQFDQLRFSF